MRRYIGDRLFVLLEGAVLFLMAPGAFPDKMVWAVQLAIIAVWGIWCKAILLLPLDMLVGTKTQPMALRCLDFVDGEFFRKSCYARSFWQGEKKKIMLICPWLTNKNDYAEMAKCSGERFVVTYYRFSKLVVRVEK